MDREILAALRRIEAIAHYYRLNALHLDEMADAFKSIVDEASEAIALVKKSNGPDLLAALEGLLEDATHLGLADSDYSGSAIEARTAIAKAKA